MGARIAVALAAMAIAVEVIQLDRARYLRL
jgi:hypothetical protein